MADKTGILTGVIAGSLVASGIGAITGCLVLVGLAVCGAEVLFPQF